MKVDRNDKINMYRLMYKIRAFEEKTILLSRRGLVGGSLHLCIGEEAVAVGAIYDLTDEDYITSTHRGHGHCIAKGADIGKMFAELLGKETGYCRGRGGSMHIADLALKILGANGIVGAGTPIAVGAALAIKYRSLDQVVLCFFGDGATNTGAFHEAVNLAATWRLPVVFVCENNMYAVTMPIEKACGLDTLADRASGYSIPGICLDGNDVEAVRSTSVEAVKRARSGEGPSFLECKTYRWLGHHMGDDGKYRPRDEVEFWKQHRDPIKNYAQKLLDDQSITKEDLERVHNEVAQEIDIAVQFAQESSIARLESAFEDIYCTATQS